MLVNNKAWPFYILLMCDCFAVIKCTRCGPEIEETLCVVRDQPLPPRKVRWKGQISNGKYGKCESLHTASLSVQKASNVNISLVQTQNNTWPGGVNVAWSLPDDSSNLKGMVLEVRLLWNNGSIKSSITKYFYVKSPQLVKNRRFSFTGFDGDYSQTAYYVKVGSLPIHGNNNNFVEIYVRFCDMTLMSNSARRQHIEVQTVQTDFKRHMVNVSFALAPAQLLGFQNYEVLLKNMTGNSEQIKVYSMPANLPLPDVHGNVVFNNVRAGKYKVCVAPSTPTNVSYMYQCVCFVYVDLAGSYHGDTLSSLEFYTNFADGQQPTVAIVLGCIIIIIIAINIVKKLCYSKRLTPKQTAAAAVATAAAAAVAAPAVTAPVTTPAADPEPQLDANA